MNKPLVLAISGGSGAVYAVRLLQMLLADDREVHLSISSAGRAVLQHELGLEIDLERCDPQSLPLDARRAAENPRLAPLLAQSSTDNATPAALRGRLVYHHYRDLMAPIASGSFLTGGMVVCPCSGGTASAIAHGTSGNLIQRAADVHLKEHRRLLLVPRETPLSAIQLDNLKRCAEAGAVVLPAMPGFYHGVRTICDLVDFVVARICDQLEVPHRLMRRWGESDETPPGT